MSRNIGALPGMTEPLQLNIMKPINKLTTLSVTLKYLKEVEDIAIHRLMPWNLLWQRDNQFAREYERSKFDFEDSVLLEKAVDASVDDKTLKEQFKEESEKCFETVVHYVDVLKEILRDIIMMKKREKLMILCGQQSDPNQERQKRIQLEYPMPDFLSCERQWAADEDYSLVAAGSCPETKWLVNWLLMCVGAMSAEHLVICNWPKSSDDCESYSFLPLSSSLAWEPFFLVHQAKAELFSKYLWSVDPDHPSLLKAGTKRGFLDREWGDRGSEHCKECLFGRDLGVFRRGEAVGRVMCLFKEWGYQVDDAWEFFRPESGFLSRVFQPSTQVEGGYCPDDEDAVADDIFRKLYIPALFRKVVGKPSPAKKKDRK